MSWRARPSCAPSRGRCLSIARAAAEGARAHKETLIELVRSAPRRAPRTRWHTHPNSSPVLKQAGVVDCGGTGLLLFFDALCHVRARRPLPVAPWADTIDVHVARRTECTRVDNRGAALRGHVSPRRRGHKMAAFREVWAGIGDSIVIVGGDGLYNCHIHTDDIGAAIEAALDAGRPREIRVTDLAEQVIEERWVREASAEQPDDELDRGPGDGGRRGRRG